MAKTVNKMRVSGSGDAWSLHECVFQDDRLVSIWDWKTLFRSREEAEEEGKAYVAHMTQTAPGDTAEPIDYVFDGDMPVDVAYNHYDGTPVSTEGSAVRVAWERVRNTPELRPYAEIIMRQDRYNLNEHYRWVATSPTETLLDWGRKIQDGEHHEH